MHYTHCIRCYKFDEMTGKYCPTKDKLCRSFSFSDACHKLDELEQDFKDQNVSTERRGPIMFDVYIVKENGKEYLDEFYVVEEDNNG